MGFIKGLLSVFILASCFLSSGAQKTVCTKEALADIIFLVDGSWSIGTENFQRIREFLFTLVDSFDVGPDKVRIGLVQYSNSPRTEFNLNSYESKQEVHDYIANLPYMGGGTKTGLGLDFLLKNHFREEAGSRAKMGVAQIAVVITDGQSQDNVEAHAQELKRRGIVLYAIGIKDADMEQLKEIATKPHDKHIYSVSDFTALQGISQGFIHVLCTTVEEAKRQVSEVPQGCKANLADIVFLVDGSSSIGDEDFLKVKQFLHTFIDGLDVRSNKIRVGLVQFTNDPHQEILLGKYADKNELLEKVDKLIYRKGGTETGKALSFLHNNSFTQAGGSRIGQNVPQIAVVITDGDSTDDMKTRATELRNKGVLIFTIGVGEVNITNLQSIANKPHRRFLINFGNYQELVKATASTMDRVCVSAEDQQQAVVPKFADVFVLVDSSVQQTDELSKFLIELTDRLNVSSKSNQMALAQFSEDVSVEFLFNAYKTKNEAVALIRKFQLQATGQRNLGKAMDFIRTRLLNADSGSRIGQGFKQYLLVVSRGESDDTQSDVIRAARDMKSEGVTIVNVDLSKKTELVFIKLPSPASARPGELPPMKKTMIASPRKTFFTAQKNVTQITQDVTSVIATVSRGAISEECKSAQLADIVFIVDVSNAVQNFMLVRNFLYHMINGLEISADNVRVGMILYSDMPKAEFYLNEFDSKREILQYINILRYRGGEANTGKALKLAREKVFSEDLGSRRAQGVPQIAVVITGGKSHDDIAIEAYKLRRSGVSVYALGIGNDNIDQLNEIASYPSQQFVFSVENFDKIYTVETPLRKTLCSTVAFSTFDITDRYNLKQGCRQIEEADIYFLIDDSGSITHPDFDDMRKFIREFLQLFKIGPKQVRVGLAKYADSPTLEFDLTTYNNRESIVRAVNEILHKGGGTNTGAALTYMRRPFVEARKTRKNVPQILIVITDGKSSDKVKGPAAALRNQGVSIYAIGVKEANGQELLEMAGDQKKMFFVTNYDALAPLQKDILTYICSDEACKNMLADIIFLVDGSLSIGTEDFSKMTDFVDTLVSKLKIGKDSVQVGLVQFSTDAQAEFALNRYYDKSEMKEAIIGIQQMDKYTLIGNALDFVSPYFDPPEGGRPDAPKFLIVITDGESQDEVSAPAKALRDKGVTIYSIGVRDANQLQLRSISGSPSNVIMGRDFDALSFLEKDLLLKICSYADDCQKTQVADVVFLVDGSTSIAEEDFESMKVFMNLVVNSTQVGQDNVRFCSIVYSSTPEGKFPLSRYSSKREVQEAISGIKAPGGDTYTAKALQYSLAYFDPARGGRAKRGIPQMMFVITDGEATDKGELPERADELQNRGISVYGIGVAKAKRSELEVITKDEKKVFHVNDYEALKALHHKISTVLCNNSKPECQKEAADLVILIDGSESIDEREWATMINFMLRLIDGLRIREDLFRVGVAQFSTGYQKEFYLNEKMNAKDVKDAIRGIGQLSDGTKIGNALQNVREFFDTSKGSRINSAISQNLLLITDGKSSDSVKVAAETLRASGIEMFVIGIGDVSQPQLNDIAGSSERVFFVDSFDSLKLNRTTQQVIDIICTEEQKGRPDCTVEIGIGFDVSRGGASSQSLFSGQSKLQTYLHEIVRQISTLNKLCCLNQPNLKTKTAFRLVARNGNLLYDTGFGEYSDDVMNKIMAQQITQAVAFNSQLLQSFQDMFKASKAGSKVVIIFTDGLDDSVEVLMRSSEELRKSGVHALLVVALEGVRSTTDLQKLEFGRGFDYKEPLTIGMRNVASAMQKQIDTVALRECCNVTCKCTGHDGVRGPGGPPGEKGHPGLKGHPGYPGEEGGMGDRGTPGLNGTQGHRGCPGKRGQKGNRGYRGDMGEAGEDGVDGVNGEQGVAGPAGSKGELGDLGSPGQRGVRGVPGVPGEKGLRGDPGESGFDNRGRGPKGDVGNSGLPGEIGQDGNPGIPGEAGKPGQKGRRGDAGQPGLRGPAGTPGLQGPPGATGPQGRIGPNGVPGQKGTFGLPGPQGRPGTPGSIGSKGNIGPRGQKGQLGDTGNEGSIGPMGPRGLPGSDGSDGYGVRGPKGQKGDIGFPGYPGLQGEAGDPGTPGVDGRKGNRGRGGDAGSTGIPGDPGSFGLPGHRGAKGPPGSRAMSPCELISYVRDNCVCCKADNGACPAYPTELVIGLDMSNGVTDAVFQRMRNTVLSLLDGINFAESNCPTGTRVAVVSYSSNTKYLIRFSDYQRKKGLMEAVNNTALERTTNQRNIGAAMRFVGRNVFKRVRQGVLMRKVAIFLTAGPSQDQSSIVTAVLGYKALDINLGVIAFRSAPNVLRAFEADETGSFILTLVERPRDQSAALKRIQQCVVCFDPCRPAPGCPNSSAGPVPKEVDVDLALLVDGSRSMQEDEYEGVKQVLGTVLDQLAVSRQPNSNDRQARVALYQQSSTYSEVQAPVKQIFTFQEYQDRDLMKQSISQKLQQTGGSSRLGRALNFAITNGLLAVSRPRKYKMLLVVVGDETDYYDQETLDLMSRAAKCEGIVTLVLTVGNRFNSTQVEELASIPIEQHIVHLNHVKQQEQEYAQRFVRTFLQTLIKSMNIYQNRLLRGVCDAVQRELGKGQGNVEVFETAERPTIEWFPLPPTAYPEEGEEEEVVEQEEDTSYTKETGTQVEIHLTPGRGDSNAQCLLDKDAGTVCRGYVQRWYYDIALGACSLFWYGGCDGNNNRFRTEIECMETCSTYSSLVDKKRENKTKDACLLRNDPGPCRNYVLRWSYDTQQKACAPFWYGGCDGNANRFDTQEKCEALCIDTV